MSGPTEFHGARLIETITGIEAQCEEALSQGYAPLLDAVEIAKLLRALVSGAEEYEPNAQLVRQRFALARTRGYQVSAPRLAWRTICAPADGVNEEGGAA